MNIHKIILRILVVCSTLTSTILPAFSYDKELENILWTSPNLEAIEYVYVVKNNIEDSISYLDNAITTVTNSAEAQIKKDVRLLQLNFLKAFVYLNQNSTKTSKKDAKKLAKDIISDNIDNASIIMNKRPEFSDVYSLAALSYFFYGRTGFSGMLFLTSKKSTVLEYLQKAVVLNPNNPFARVSYANFDSAAPSIAGADSARATKTLEYPLDDAWPKIYQFEYHLSKMINAQHTENQTQLEKEKNIALSLYPDNWRVNFALGGIEE